MQALLQTNIKKCIATLGSGFPPFDEEAQAAIGDRVFFTTGSWTPSPAAYWVGSSVQCAQAGYFGFYALRTALRGVLLSLNHLTAGMHSLNRSLFAPGIASLYAAAFHTLHSFLALNGRAITSSPLWLTDDPSGSPAMPRPFMATLTRGNRWVFEPRTIGHRWRWQELRQVWAGRSAPIPDYFHGLWEHYSAGMWEWAEGLSRTEQLKRVLAGDASREDLRPALRDHLAGFIDWIAQVRHISLYESFGEDPAVVKALVNHDAFSTDGIDRQASAFGAFCVRFLADMSSTVRAAVSGLKPAAIVRQQLYLSVHLPLFDAPKLDLCANDSIRTDLAYLLDWVAEK